MHKFYTYLWLRENGTPYYVGKGHGNRARWRGKTSKLKPPSLHRILTQEFPDEDSAFAAEKFLIDFYGRKDLGLGPLINHTNGGEGASGLIVTEENRSKARKTMTGNSYRVGKPSWNKGMTFTKTTRKPRSQETKDKIRNTLRSKGIKPPNQLGYKHTEEAKKKIGQAQRDRYSEWETPSS